MKRFIIYSVCVEYIKVLWQYIHCIIIWVLHCVKMVKISDVLQELVFYFGNEVMEN